MSVPWHHLQAAIASNPQRDVQIQSAPVPAPVLTVPWLPVPGWTEDTGPVNSDIVSVALWIRDPLYRIAAPSVRRAMEMEEAATLIEMSERAWKQHGGRVRGWVRKHLEEDLRLRAGGGDATPDFWSAVQTNKRAALVVDYVCVVRGFHLSLWWPEEQVVHTIPIGGGVPVDGPVGMVQLNCDTGRILLAPDGAWHVPLETWKHLVSSTETGPKWSPHAAAGIRSGVTVEQLQEELRELGVTSFKGSRQRTWNHLLWLRMIRRFETKHEEPVCISPDTSDSS